MTDEITETIEEPDAQLFEFKKPEPDLTEEDVEPPYHTVLESWREALKPAKDERTKKVTPQWGSRIVNTYKDVQYNQMDTFSDLYFDLIEELLQILVDEIATDDECLTYSSVEEDIQYNSGHYKELLFAWQLAFLKHELDWDTNSPFAGVKIGVLSEVHKMFFADTGISAHLDSINFVFTESDQAELAQALNDLKEAQ
jgi:hypothetical protein